MILISHRVLLVLSVAMVLLPPAPLTSISASAGPSGCNVINAQAVVYAAGGAVFRVDPDGRNRCRLTSRLGAVDPVLAPGGRFVAFAAASGSHGGNRFSGVVRVAPAAGHRSTGATVRVSRQAQGGAVWSSDGRRLAFIDGNDVWTWSVACRCSRVLVRGSTGKPAGFPTWSPDSRHLAVARISTVNPVTRSMALTIADIITGGSHMVSVSFPSWLRGHGPYQESYPSQIIGWLPNGKLLLGTNGLGAGLWLTGIWTAPAVGGSATLLVGVPKSPRLLLRFPLLNATHALISPNATKLLLDPDNRFWIASSAGKSGRLLGRLVSGSCAVSQIAWEGNGKVAYVTVCSTSTSAVLSRLYMLSITGGAPKLLMAARATDQEWLSIAPPTRCVACGGA